jgi:hypothetical protein
LLSAFFTEKTTMEIPALEKSIFQVFRLFLQAMNYAFARKEQSSCETQKDPFCLVLMLSEIVKELPRRM